MWKIAFWAAMVPLLLLAGCAGSDPPVQTSRVEIYRTVRTPDPAMEDLCRQLQASVDRDNVHNRTEVKEYTRETDSGDEYAKLYHERRRYSEAARTRDEMLVLCTQIR